MSLHTEIEIFRLMAMMVGIMLFGALLSVAVHGQPFMTAALAIAVSPVVMLTLRVSMEYGRPGGMFSPRTQSWAFLFGDTVCIPAALGLAALSWRRSEVVHHWAQVWWMVASLAVGVAGSYVFHRFLNAPAYAGANASRLLSPTSIWHDGVVYPILLTAVVMIVVPAVVTDHNWWCILPLVGWLLCGAADGIRDLDPANLHPRVEDTRLGY